MHEANSFLHRITRHKESFVHLEGLQLEGMLEIKQHLGMRFVACQSPNTFLRLYNYLTPPNSDAS